MRKRRTEILLKGSKDISVKLAQEIRNKYEVKTVEEPNPGTVMVKVREQAQGSLFYLGEVLVTECKVMIDGALGMGIVAGDEPELASDLAVIDAAYNGELPETKAWAGVLLMEEDRRARKNKVLKNKILKTKVNFETMDV